MRVRSMVAGTQGEEHGPRWPNLSRLGANSAVLGLKFGRTQADLGPTGLNLSPTWTAWVQLGLSNMAQLGRAWAQVGLT